jgi:Zn-dependent protease
MQAALLHLAAYALPIFLTLTMPIALQAWLANRMGDSTPRQHGRLSWDPVRHMDWLGTVVLPALFLLVSGNLGGGFIIGWGKSLELDVRAYRSKAQMLLIESTLIIGPLLMALFWTVLLKLSRDFGFSGFFSDSVCAAGINVGLSFFAIALLPFPPLPLGNAILRNLPLRYLMRIAPYLQYAPYLILALLLIGVLNPYIRAVYSLGAVIVQAVTFWL